MAERVFFWSYTGTFVKWLKWTLLRQVLMQL